MHYQPSGAISTAPSTSDGEKARRLGLRLLRVILYIVACLSGLRRYVLASIPTLDRFNIDARTLVTRSRTRAGTTRVIWHKSFAEPVAGPLGQLTVVS